MVFLRSSWRGWLPRWSTRPTANALPISTSSEGETVIRVHEDDWGSRNIFPLGPQYERVVDLDAPDAFAATLKASSGDGWTLFRALTPSPGDYLARRIRVAEMASALALELPRVKHFYHSQYGPYENNAWCFGFNLKCFIKLETKGNLVDSIWFEYGISAGESEAIRRALKQIDKLCPSFVADYGSGELVLLSDDEGLTRYLHGERQFEEC